MANLAENLEEEGSRCRQVARTALGMVLRRLEAESDRGVVSIERVRKIARTLACDGALLSVCCDKMEQDCAADFSARRFEGMRNDYFGRVVVRPFAGELDVGPEGIDRRHLPQFFTALRMMLGNEVHGQLVVRCNEAAARHRGLGRRVDWQGFYADPDVLAAFETVAVALAQSFGRYDIRKEWLLTIMNSNPKAGLEFTPRHKLRVMKAIYSGEFIQTVLTAGRSHFLERWGEAPEKLFGPLLVRLGL